MPDRLKTLLIDDRGYPVPYFVTVVDGKPDHRVTDGQKIADAVRFGLCWICGGKLGRHVTFAIGPMCAVNRISSEPPAHFDCAEWSARACPFLTRPHSHRREAGKPEGVSDPAGTMIRRNPGVVLLWETSARYRLLRVHNGTLFEIPEPEKLTIYAEGRSARHDELADSFESGVDILRRQAADEGPAAVEHLERQAAVARVLLGLREIAAPSAVGRAESDAKAGDPHGASGPQGGPQG